jgi:hypothetical protein
MAVFHSLPYNKIIQLLNGSGLVAGDLYFSTDSSTLYVACTNTDGAVGIAQTGLILTGNLQLGFNGNAASIAGAAVVGTPQAGDVLIFDGESWIPQAESGGQTNNVTTQSGDYSTTITDGTILCNGGAPQTITLTTTGLKSGDVYTVKVIGNSTATVQAQSGLIDGESSFTLYSKDAVDLVFDGTNFYLE